MFDAKTEGVLTKFSEVNEVNEVNELMAILRSNLKATFGLVLVSGYEGSYYGHLGDFIWWYAPCKH